jgi:hypothetical protein
MVRAIRNEYDAEWYAWRDELAHRRKLALAEKEYMLWKETQKPSQIKPRIVPISVNNNVEKNLNLNKQERFAF